MNSDRLVIAGSLEFEPQSDIASQHSTFTKVVQVAQICNRQDVQLSDNNWHLAFAAGVASGNIERTAMNEEFDKVKKDAEKRTHKTQLHDNGSLYPCRTKSTE